MAELTNKFTDEGVKDEPVKAEGFGNGKPSQAPKAEGMGNGAPASKRVKSGPDPIVI